MATKTKAYDKALLLAAVAKSKLLSPEAADIEELGGVIYARRMSVGEREEYFEAMKKVEGTGNAEAFVRAAVDENGEALFDDSDEELAIVKSLPPSITQAVLAKFNEINHLVRPSPKQDEEEIKKNS